MRPGTSNEILCATNARRCDGFHRNLRVHHVVRVIGQRRKNRLANPRSNPRRILAAMFFRVQRSVDCRRRHRRGRRRGECSRLFRGKLRRLLRRRKRRRSRRRRWRRSSSKRSDDARRITEARANVTSTALSRRTAKARRLRGAALCTVAGHWTWCRRQSAWRCQWLTGWRKRRRECDRKNARWREARGQWPRATLGKVLSSVYLCDGASAITRTRRIVNVHVEQIRRLALTRCGVAKREV